MSAGWPQRSGPSGERVPDAHLRAVDLRRLAAPRKGARRPIRLHERHQELVDADEPSLVFLPGAKGHRRGRRRDRAGARIGTASPADNTVYNMGQLNQCAADVQAGDCNVMPQVWPAP